MTASEAPLNGGSGKSTTPQTRQNRCYPTDSATDDLAASPEGSCVYVPLSQRCHDCYEFGHEACGCGECGATYCGSISVGAQVMFAENEKHTTSLGVVTRVWDNRRYVTVVSDGHMFVRLIERVRPCR